MLIGIPREMKPQESRVGATPSTVRSLIHAGHEVWVEESAGKEIGYFDSHYTSAGAKIVSTKQELYQAEMIIKVKEPQKEEYPLLKEGQILFCYLHLAPDPVQTEALLKSKVVGIAYETITDDQNRLPLLIPMSEIAGRISVQAGAYALQMAAGGRGVLLGGIPGVKPGKVLVLGGGIVGTESMRMALGLGADVTIMDIDWNRLRTLDMHFAPSLKTRYATRPAILEELESADLVVGAVLIPGAAAPRLVTEEMLSVMKPKSVIVDVSIDQGGCFETSRPTTHVEPIFVHKNVLHYCVSNMPAACAKTATEGLTNATLPYALKIANQGWQKAVEDTHIKNGLNVCLGEVTHAAVARDLNYTYVSPDEMIHATIS